MNDNKQIRKILENNDEQLAFIEGIKGIENKIKELENAKELNKLIILFIIIVLLLSIMAAIILTLLN